MITRKRSFLTLAAVLVSIAAIFLGASLRTKAAGTTWPAGDSVTCEFSDGTLTISGTGELTGSWSENSPIEDIITKVTNVRIGDGITRIGSYAFMGCGSLKTITLGAKVKTLGAYILRDTQVETLSIPASVEEMDSYAFLRTPLKSITIASGNKQFMTRDGIVYSKDGKTIICCPSGLPLESFKNTTATTIEEYAFAFNQNLTHVDLTGIESIGQYAFIESKLTELVFPDSLTSVGNGVFLRSESLESVRFGKGLKESSHDLFGSCTALKNVDFGGLQKVYGGTFEDCTALVSVDLSESVTELDALAFSRCTELESITMKAVEKIGPYCFDFCRKLSKVSLNEGLKQIETMAFVQALLTEIDIPASVTFIEDLAFSSIVEIRVKNPILVRYGTNGYKIVDHVAIAGKRDYQMAYEVLKLVNEERAKEGLNPLTMDEDLLEAAMIRAEEQVAVMGHTRPNSEQCYSASPKMHGENVAGGQSTAAKVMEDWMNSTGHRANILRTGYTSIGIGCFICEPSVFTYHWCQAFGYDELEEDCPQPANRDVIAQIDIPYNSLHTEESNFEFLFDILDVPSLMAIGGQAQARVRMNLKMKVDPSCLHWTSSDPSVLTVSADGIVHAVGGGTATLTASTQYVERASVTVTVQGATDKRLYGSNRYNTSFAIANELKRVLGIDKFSAVIVASGKGYADALAGSYLASRLDAPILLVEEKKISQVAKYIQANLVSGGTVYVLGGKLAVPETFDEAVKSFASVKRLAGKTRYETNMAILEEAGLGRGKMLICSGENYPDSLSASAFGLPILLVKKKLTDAQEDFIWDHWLGSNEYMIIGGTAAVDASVETRLKPYGKVTRAFGSTRYKTSAALAEQIEGDPAAVILAYGENFPDGLCGGPLAHALGVPLLLVKDKTYAPAAAYVKAHKIAGSVILGGPGIISDDTVKKVMAR